ncbi:DUF4421 family protein [Aequorivita ciconiae]|uniref:DUF4421 family protein n=1 Tax=Aequorivita ciconiae TaxID=2494375 RepID=UPI0013E3632B|nr:DUF4421 family protein [Aequorivita sp. H23M31]
MFVVICAKSVGLSQVEKARDSSYFISYTDKVVVGLNVDTQTDTYIFRDDSFIDRMEITPNNLYRLSVSVDYKFIGVSLGFAPSFFKEKDAQRLKGESSFSDYKFHFFFGQFVQGLQYQSTKGYYFVNTGDYIDDWQDGKDPYVQFPDLKKTIYGMSSGYVFNKNFSYRSLIGYTERQIKSAGSVVPILYYDYTRFSNVFYGEKSVEKQLNFRLAVGYYYTFVLSGKWFATAGLSPSIAVRFSHFIDSEADGHETQEKETYLLQALDGVLQIGFNGRRFFGGGKLILNADKYDEDSQSHIENNQIYSLAYFGLRFDAPRFISKPVEDVENKVQKNLESLKKEKPKSK